MKIPVNGQSIGTDGIAIVLQKNLPDYTTFKINDTLCIARKNKWAGATISIRKNKVVIRGNFAKAYLSLVFAVVTVLTGLVTGILIYYILLFPKMKKAEKEVTEALIKEIHQVES